MFKGYISTTIGHVLWIIHNRQSFLIPYLEKIKETANDPLLTILKKDRYKILAEFKITHANRVQAYLVKIYKYPRLFQKVKYLFKHTKGFNEFSTNYIAAMKGIPAQVPLACGERTRFFAKESYLIFKKIKHALTVREYFRSNISREERRDILEKFGRLARKIHDSGIKQDDFSLDNFLIYADETGEKRVILIDFERVSIQTKFLEEKHRVWYLAKLNRARKYFKSTDRLRFLLSYTGRNFDQCKKLAKQIEEVTVRIQRKDARKFWRQCIQENRKFGILKNAEFYGYYRKSYSLETFTMLLSVIERTALDVFYVNQFRIVRAMPHPRAKLDYSTIIRTWMHANALFALMIDAPVPIGIFKRHFPRQQKEGFFISQMPDNCVPLNQRSDLYKERNLLFALSGLVEQVSPFGVFCKDLSPQDILVQTQGNYQPKCYLGNYTSFHINRFPIQKNRSINTHIIKQLLQTSDAFA